MIDSNADKKCEKNSQLIDKIEKWFRNDGVLLLSEWKRKIKTDDKDGNSR